MKSLYRNYFRAFFAMGALYVTFIAILNFTVIRYEREELLNTAKANLEDNLVIVGQSARQFLKENEPHLAAWIIEQWAEKVPQVVHLEAVLPDGTKIVDRTKPGTNPVHFRHTQEVGEGGKTLLTIHMAADFSDVTGGLTYLAVQFAAASIIFTLCLALALWQALRYTALKPLEEEIAGRRDAEEALRRANEGLEDRVRERTAELGEASRRLAEELKKSREQGLQIAANRDRLDKILHSLPVGIALLDVKTRTVADINAALAAMIGLPRSHLLGKSCCLYFCAGAEPHGNCKVLDKGQEVRGVKHELSRADGTPLHVTKSVVEIEIDGERYLLESILDLSDQQKVEEQNRQLQDLLFQAQKMQAIGTLAGGVAHDFRNLLQIIQSYADFLRAADGLTPDMIDKLDKILSTSQKGADLTDQLLAFSRKDTARFTTTDLNELLLDAVEMGKRMFPKTVRVQTLLTPKSLPVHADATKIQQVVLNLLLNSLDAMPEDGLITVETEELLVDELNPHLHAELAPGRHAVLRVADNGSGMDSGTVARVFEPFFTTKEVGKGTGLGLAVAYGVVKEHGGHIVCESEPGKGTTFSVYLPRAEDTAAPGKAALTHRSQGRASRAATLLLVDDERQIAETSREILMVRGYNVWTAHSGEEALELYTQRGGEIDLVLLDLGMPGMGGMACLKQLLSLDPAVKVIIASGYSLDGQAKGIFELGAKDYVVKPYRIDTLEAAIGRVLVEA
jgi:PAS domain S-box-containing protein